MQNRVSAVCMRTLRISSSLSFTKIVLFLLKISYIFHKYFLKSIFIRLGLKPTLGLRVLPSLGNGGLSHKWYKIRSLQMPFFWFMSSAIGIRRKRDKTFCFDVWFGPNPRTRQTTHIHGARCNSVELRGIRMFEVPQVLLEKRVTIGSISQNLVFQL